MPRSWEGVSIVVVRAMGVRTSKINYRNSRKHSQNIYQRYPFLKPDKVPNYRHTFLSVLPSRIHSLFLWRHRQIYSIPTNNLHLWHRGSICPHSFTQPSHYSLLLLLLPCFRVPSDSMRSISCFSLPTLVVYTQL